MKASDASRLKELEPQNARLKRSVANQALDIDMLKEISAGNFPPLNASQSPPTMLRDRFGVSERRACTVVGIHRSTMRLTPPPISDEEAELRAWLRKFSTDRPRWGWRRAAKMARRAGWQVNNKRTRLTLIRSSGGKMGTEKTTRGRAGGTLSSHAATSG